MARNDWVQPVPFEYHAADATAVTASATLTELTPTPQAIIPYPWMHANGAKFRFEAWLIFTTTATQGTITFDMRIGTAGAIGSLTSIAASSALTWLASQTNRLAHITGLIQVRTAGPTGTIVGWCDATEMVSGAVDTPAAVFGSTTGTAAINTQQPNAFALGVTLSVASQSVACKAFAVESVN